MPKGLVIYYSRSGNTKAMANTIASAMEESGLSTKCKSVSDIKIDDLVDADAIVVGSPTYYGKAAAPRQGGGARQYARGDDHVDDVGQRQDVGLR